jgi:putative tryptophan/tyrosine transport system substrate-binding protein
MLTGLEYGMRRREFISGSTAVVAGLLSARTAIGATGPWRIGQVFGGTPDIIAPSELAKELSELRYIEGRNISLQTTFATPNPMDMRAAIERLLPEIDLLVVWGTIGGVAAKAAAPSIPVVFISVGAPVDIGLVESLAHPGGNMTGTTFEAASETYGKRLQLLKDILPDLSRVAVIGAKADPNVPFAMISLEKSAPLLGVSLTSLAIGSADDLPNAFEQMKRGRSEAVIVIAGALTYQNFKLTAELALANALPSCHGFKETVNAGGLISLGPDMLALARQGATLVDKIIKGARPGDLPVEQPTRYVTSINLKTAKLLGLTIPSALLASADEVIE